MCEIKANPLKRRRRTQTGTSRWSKYRRVKADIKRWESELHLTDHEGTSSDAENGNVPGTTILSQDTADLADVQNDKGGDYCVLEPGDDETIEVENTVKAGNYNIEMSMSLVNQLARWCVAFSVNSVAFTVLLKILVAYQVVVDLPRDSRTVLRTARSVKTKTVSGGEYFHFGLPECLSQMLKLMSSAVFEKLPDVLQIAINMDGLPCFKSVSTHLWPILGSLYAFGKSSRPFTIAVFYGVEKNKNVHEYLSDFVADYNTCRTTGFKCRGRLFKVNVRVVICDAPARAFVKNVYNHNSCFPCERCKVNRKSYCTIAAPRNDTDILKLDVNHNKGPSPLSECGIRLVSQVVLDYMHLILLGIVKKLITMWLETKVREDWHCIRLDITMKDEITNRLLSYIETCPKEFARKPRSISNFRMYKATEFRMFLLYTGIMCLKGKVASRVYHNFLLLACAMRIYLCDRSSKKRNLCQHAQAMLKAFVVHYKKIYGEKQVVYNVHSLLHIHEDVAKYGNLEHISSFPFENYMQGFKRKIRSGKNSFQQLIRRIDEEQRFSFLEPDVFDAPDGKVRYLHRHEFPLPESLQQYRNDIEAQYKVVEYKGVRFSVFSADSCIRLQDSSRSVGKIVNIARLKNGDCMLVYRLYQKMQSLFEYPMNSEDVGISAVEKLSDFIITTSVAECQKAWLFPTAHENKWVAIDMLS